MTTPEMVTGVLQMEQDSLLPTIQQGLMEIPPNNGGRTDNINYSATRRYSDIDASHPRQLQAITGKDTSLVK